MLSLIVRCVVQDGYAKQNRGFGGERRGREAIRDWFEQVRRDYGRLRLTAHDVAVSGPPWNLRVIVRFSVTS